MFTREVRLPGGLFLEAWQAVPPARGWPGALWASGCCPAAAVSCHLVLSVLLPG